MDKKDLPPPQKKKIKIKINLKKTLKNGMNPLRTKNNLISSSASLAQQTRTPNALFQTEGHLYEKLQLLPLCVTE